MYTSPQPVPTRSHSPFAYFDVSTQRHSPPPPHQAAMLGFPVELRDITPLWPQRLQQSWNSSPPPQAFLAPPRALPVLADALPHNTGKEYYYDTQPKTSQLIWPQGTQPSAAFSQVVPDVGFPQVKRGQDQMTQIQVLTMGSPAPNNTTPHNQNSDDQPTVKIPKMNDYEEEDKARSKVKNLELHKKTHDRIQEAREYLSTLDDKKTDIEEILVNAAYDNQWSVVKSMRDFVNTIHGFNLGCQPRDQIYQLIQLYTKMSESANEEHGSKELSKLTQDMCSDIRFKLISRTLDRRLQPSTVGNTAIHSAFLLGDHELGRAMIHSTALCEAYIDSLIDAFSFHPSFHLKGHQDSFPLDSFEVTSKMTFVRTKSKGTEQTDEVETDWQNVKIELDLEAGVHLRLRVKGDKTAASPSTRGQHLRAKDEDDHQVFSFEGSSFFSSTFEESFSSTNESITVCFLEPILASSDLKVSLPVKKIQFQRIGQRNDDWTFLKCCLDVNKLRAKYQQNTAIIINMPYESDLDPWFLGSMKGHSREVPYLKELKEKKSVSMAHKNKASFDKFYEKIWSKKEEDKGTLEQVCATVGWSGTQEIAVGWSNKCVTEGTAPVMTNEREKTRISRIATMQELHELIQAGSAQFLLATAHDPWLDPSDVSNNKGRDGGLFTGETILHIAIVKRDLDSIEWLLDHGAELTCRAVGTFFQDAVIPRFTSDKTWIKQKIGSLETKWVTFVNNEFNQYGGACNYGEFPLSFAASVGDECACHLLCARASRLIGEAILTDLRSLLRDKSTARYIAMNGSSSFSSKDWCSKFNEEIEQLLNVTFSTGQYVGTAEPKQFQMQLENWIIENVVYGHRMITGYKKVVTLADSAPVYMTQAIVIVKRYQQLLQSAFLNRRNSEGNTALHLAVKFKQTSTIDWLLDNGAKPSLDMLNNEDYTPMTLAVRQGDVATYEHLTERLQVQAWTYGSTCMTCLPLAQIDTFRIIPPGSVKRREEDQPVKSQTHRVGQGKDRSLSFETMAALDMAKTAALLFLQSRIRGMIIRCKMQNKSTWTRYIDMFFIFKTVQDPIKYLVREMKPIASDPARLLKSKDIVLALRGPVKKDAGLWDTLKECKIIDKKTNGHYRVKSDSVSASNNESFFDFIEKGGDAMKEMIENKQIRYVLVKDGDCLHRDPQWRSALEIVVENEVKAFFDCENPTVFQAMIENKWFSFARSRHFFTTIMPYGLFLGIATALCLVRVAFVWEVHTGPHTQESYVKAPFDELDQMPNVVLALYVILFVGGIPFLLWDAVFWMRIRSTDCDPNGDMKISFDEALFFLYKNLSVLTSLSLVFWLIAMLSLCYSSWDGSNIRMFDMESVAMASMLIIAWCKLLHMFVPYSMGQLLITVWRMILGDVSRWMVIFIFFLSSFGMAISILNHKNFMVYRDSHPTFADTDGVFTSTYFPFDRLRRYVFVMLGDVNTQDLQTEVTNQVDLTIFHLVYTFLASLLLQSLLVAMMSETYAREREAEGLAMWWMLHAQLVLHCERLLWDSEKRSFRYGKDNDPGKAHSECRPFFLILVGSTESDALHSGKKNPRLTTNNLLRQFLKSNGGAQKRLSHMDAKMQAVLQRTDHLVERLSAIDHSSGSRTAIPSHPFQRQYPSAPLGIC